MLQLKKKKKKKKKKDNRLREESFGCSQLDSGQYHERAFSPGHSPFTLTIHGSSTFKHFLNDHFHSHLTGDRALNTPCKTFLRLQKLTDSDIVAFYIDKRV